MENVKSINVKDVIYTSSIDLVMAILVVLIPTISHMIPIPIYYLDPMRWMVLGILFLKNNYTNAIVMACLLPLISFAFSGHPVFPKCLLISMELTINVLFFVLLNRKISWVGVSMFLSMLISKCIYYLFKYVLIFSGVLSTNLIDTKVIYQLIPLFCLPLFFEIRYHEHHANTI